MGAVSRLSSRTRRARDLHARPQNVSQSPSSAAGAGRVGGGATAPAVAGFGDGVGRGLGAAGVWEAGDWGAPLTAGFAI